MSFPFPLVKQYDLFIWLSQSPCYGCGWLNDWQVLVNLVLGHQCRKQADGTWRTTCCGLVWGACSVFWMRGLLGQEPSYSDPNGDSEVPRHLVSADICLEESCMNKFVYIDQCQGQGVSWSCLSWCYVFWERNSDFTRFGRKAWVANWKNVLGHSGSWWNQ